VQQAPSLLVVHRCHAPLAVWHTPLQGAVKLGQSLI
jgi:hypothetical protein